MTENHVCEGCGCTPCVCPPPQCARCGEYSAVGTTTNVSQGWAVVTVDMDPGDPEVGPQPDICEVLWCPACLAKAEDEKRTRKATRN